MNRRQMLLLAAVGASAAWGCGGPKPKAEDIEKAKKELGPEFKLQMNEPDKPEPEKTN